uniref:DUF3638 domain-containing protein n=1 Tax=Chromera velia CCMP2878 TaxID=1169474 RepID=A0A0G4FS55_9ALVE|eukprot:Cvel_18510.t1-p1 / transcript=Cvel_18510.t1 / gene=Cvel_18510 / organism=Chromera_velia_CCMP2878 / gene_product=hypothetical protein / transcript_product=hypothetical protein / location=Cvel_scaffold1537:30437-37775(+) / protein_length=2145 / sequence_SO=supercontig / SO=protein_coding / is_pseudo=false
MTVLEDEQYGAGVGNFEHQIRSLEAKLQSEKLSAERFRKIADAMRVEVFEDYFPQGEPEQWAISLELLAPPCILTARDALFLLHSSLGLCVTSTCGLLATRWVASAPFGRWSATPQKTWRIALTSREVPHAPRMLSPKDLTEDAAILPCSMQSCIVAGDGAELLNSQPGLSRTFAPRLRTECEGQGARTLALEQWAVDGVGGEVEQRVSGCGYGAYTENEALCRLEERPESFPEDPFRALLRLRSEGRWTQWIERLFQGLETDSLPLETASVASALLSCAWEAGPLDHRLWMEQADGHPFTKMLEIVARLRQAVTERENKRKEPRALGLLAVLLLRLGETAKDLKSAGVRDLERRAVSEPEIENVTGACRNVCQSVGEGVRHIRDVLCRCLEENDGKIGGSTITPERLKQLQRSAGGSICSSPSELFTVRTGELLVNARPPFRGLLPDSLRQTKEFRRVFGDAQFAASRDVRYDGDLATHIQQNGLQFVFWWKGASSGRGPEPPGTLVVIERNARGGGRERQLVHMETLVGVLPPELLEGYSHWVNRRDRLLEFRPRRFDDPGFGPWNALTGNSTASKGPSAGGGLSVWGSLERGLVWRARRTSDDPTCAGGRRSYLVSVQSDTFDALFQKVFWRLGGRDLLTVWVDSGPKSGQRDQNSDSQMALVAERGSTSPQVCAELHRLGRAFYIHPSESPTISWEIESREDRGWYVASRQTPGVFMGLQQKLMLVKRETNTDFEMESKSANRVLPKERVGAKLLIPYGDLEAESQPPAGCWTPESHQKVKIKGREAHLRETEGKAAECTASCFVFELNSDLRRVDTPPSGLAHLFAAALFSLCRPPLPEPFTGRLAEDEVVERLQSGRVFGLQPFSEEELRLLDVIKRVSPKLNSSAPQLSSAVTTLVKRKIPVARLFAEVGEKPGCWSSSIAEHHKSLARNTKGAQPITVCSEEWREMLKRGSLGKALDPCLGFLEDFRVPSDFWKPPKPPDDLRSFPPRSEYNKRDLQFVAELAFCALRGHVPPWASGGALKRGTLLKRYFTKIDLEDAHPFDTGSIPPLGSDGFLERILSAFVWAADPSRQSESETGPAWSLAGLADSDSRREADAAVLCLVLACAGELQERKIVPPPYGRFIAPSSNWQYQSAKIREVGSKGLMKVETFSTSHAEWKAANKEAIDARSLWKRSEEMRERWRFARRFGGSDEFRNCLERFTPTDSLGLGFQESQRKRLLRDLDAADSASQKLQQTGSELAERVRRTREVLQKELANIQREEEVLSRLAAGADRMHRSPLHAILKPNSMSGRTISELEREKKSLQAKGTSYEHWMSKLGASKGLDLPLLWRDIREVEVEKSLKEQLQFDFDAAEKADREMHETATQLESVLRSQMEEKQQEAYKAEGHLRIVTAGLHRRYQERVHEALQFFDGMCQSKCDELSSAIDRETKAPPCLSLSCLQVEGSPLREDAYEVQVLPLPSPSKRYYNVPFLEEVNELLEQWHANRQLKGFLDRVEDALREKGGTQQAADRDDARTPPLGGVHLRDVFDYDPHSKAGFSALPVQVGSLVEEGRVAVRRDRPAPSEAALRLPSADKWVMAQRQRTAEEAAADPEAPQGSLSIVETGGAVEDFPVAPSVETALGSAYAAELEISCAQFRKYGDGQPQVEVIPSRQALVVDLRHRLTELQSLRQALARVTEPQTDGCRAMQRVGLWADGSGLRETLCKLSTVRLTDDLLDTPYVNARKTASSLALRFCKVLSRALRLRRCLALSDGGGNKQAELKRELANVGFVGWCPDIEKSWLVLEIQGDFTIRSVQAEVATELRIAALESGGAGRRSAERQVGRVIQLNMGEGKTKVIIPLLCLALRDRGIVPRVNLPRQLLGQSEDDLSSKLGGIFSCAVVPLPFSRDVKVKKDPQLPERLAAALNVLTPRGLVILVAPEHRQSLRNRPLFDVIESGGFNKLENPLGEWMDSRGVDVIDEVDEVLDCKRSLVWTVGDREEIDGGAAVWGRAQCMLRLVRRYVPQLREELGELHIELHGGAGAGSGDATNTRPPHEWQPFTPLSPQSVSRLKERLLDAMMPADLRSGIDGTNELLIALGGRQSKELQRQCALLRQYLSDSALGNAETEEAEEVLNSWGEDKIRDVILLRGFLVDGIL